MVGTHSYILSNGIASFNCQDIDIDFLPVINEVMSATIRYGFEHYTGTPKTTDGPLSVMFDASSQGHWCVPCSCGYQNLASPDQDFFKMIGKWDDNLKTGIHCVKCDKGLDTRLGYYVHAFPAKLSTFPGRHISQITHPLHCAIKMKWNQLLDKMKDYSKARLYNEVFGIPCDESIKLISLEDIRRASNDIPPDYQKALALRRNYDTVALGVDWSGGGALGHSYTAAAVVGSRPGTDRLDTLFTARLPLGLRPEEEAAVLYRYFKNFECTLLAHDYTGAGNLREILMVQHGLPQGKVIPFTYATAPKKDVITLHAPTDGSRTSYVMDKPRSLVVLMNMIKIGKVSLPELRTDSNGQPNADTVMTDLLNLVEAPKEFDRSGTIYLISRAPGRPDDFAHALNYACSSIWYMKGGYPKLDLAKYDIPEHLLRRADPDLLEKIVKQV